jgi:4-carboxymuconolactone decarboxylase
VLDGGLGTFGHPIDDASRAQVSDGVAADHPRGHGQDEADDAADEAAHRGDVLVGVVPIVGLPCVVAAAPKLALGYDTDDALEPQSGE